MTPGNDVAPAELPPQEWLTAAELAAWLRVDRETVYDMLAAGRIAGAAKLGLGRGAWRIHKPTAVAALAGGAMLPAAAAPRQRPRRRGR